MTNRHSDITGRYLYLTVRDTEYRVYYEEAGTGIPMLCQHTAGADGRQWRHQLEDPEITKDYRVIAYDLPFHGNSLPPTGRAWWKERYILTKDFFTEFIVTLADVLELEQPVFMGCSVGGHVAVDLAHDYPDRFRAVIGVEAALQTDGMWDPLFWHPRVNMEFLASMIYTITGPQSPEPFRRETAWIYQQGAPMVFPGDNYFYGDDHDLTQTAKNIDTDDVGVYVMSGEYDYSARPEECKALADEVPGSTFVYMPGMGHMPMSEDPERFKTHLMPILGDIKSNGQRWLSKATSSQEAS